MGVRPPNPLGVFANSCLSLWKGFVSNEESELMKSQGRKITSWVLTSPPEVLCYGLAKKLARFRKGLDIYIVNSCHESQTW